MRIRTLLFSIFFSFPTFAGICRETWKEENKLNPVTDACELEWKDSGIELVRLKNGCSFPGPNREPCYFLRSCGKDKQKGASVFRSSTPAESYCVSGTDIEAMGATKPFGGKAHILCNGQKKPQSLRLSDATGNLTTLCKFPF